MPRTANRIAGHLNLYSDHYDPYGSRIYLFRSRSASDCCKIRPNSEVSDNIEHMLKSSTVLSVLSTDDENDGPLLLHIIENANMDGVKHLQEKNPVTRYFWAAVIIVFVLLACFQSFKQINMFLTTPVATNVEAAYPDQIPFPAVAICNNNQFRLTYLTGSAIQNRKPKEQRKNDSSAGDVNLTVFDKVLENAWDMDAVKFLRNAAHWKSRMILSCTWPNGTSCRLSDFKAVWTLTGLCWAINTDPHNSHYISSSGSGNGLRLLLNIERYERIESCTPYFRTTSLPGLKILIYNQTDIPESSLDGVNVPPGYTMEIPFKMQKRHKYSGAGCVEESEGYRMRTVPFDDPENIHTCSIRRYLHEIEERCGCSMRRAYNLNPGEYSFCNVEQYFTCVLPTVQSGKKQSFDRFRCIPPCDQIDYTAWQDMTLLPNNIFPSLIDTVEEEDVEDIIDDYDIENDLSNPKFIISYENETLTFIISVVHLGMLTAIGLTRHVRNIRQISCKLGNWLNAAEIVRDEHFQCEQNQLLNMEQVRQIKRSAQRAYEKQSRYQEDIQLRTKRLLLKLREATQKLIDNGWGWTEETYRNAFERLNNSITCFNELPVSQAEVFAAIENPPALSEETRIANIYRLLEPQEDISGAKRFQTVVQLREAFGERFDEVVKEVQRFSSTVTRLSKIYDPSSYKSTLDVDLKRMSIILALAGQYEAGRLQRRIWAEKMQSRNMQHFFSQDFFEGWYNPILKDLGVNLVRNIVDMANDDLPELLAAVDDGRGLQLGSMLYFGDTTKQHKEQFGAFVQDIVNCTFGDVKNETIALLNLFKKVMHEFQSAYTNLYVKELPAYLANFDFGSDFIEQNFAMVNVFLHRMNVETWKQESTYSIWSLACDVGGALGLFLGASLLTVVELIYVCFQYGLCTPPCYGLYSRWSRKTHPSEKLEKSKRKVTAETKLTGVVVEGFKRPLKRPPSIKVTSEDDETTYSEQNQITIVSATTASGPRGASLEKPTTVSQTLVSDVGKDSSLVTDRLLDTGSSEEQPDDFSRSSSGQSSESSRHAFSLDSVSSENDYKLTTLFRPKKERQTFV